MKGLLQILPLSIATLCLCLFPFQGWAGGEEGKDKKPKQEQKAPEDTELPIEPETIDPSLTEAQEPPPVFEEVEEVPPKPKKARAVYLEKDLDENIDYSRLIDLVETAEAPRGVLPPALGFRGYRPSMVAVGGGDRVPGFGAMVEYSWNRIGWGVFASYRNAKGQDLFVESYGIMGTYGLYRWLPWDVSPYFLMGLEVGNQTAEVLGGLTGLGVEARIFSGWTLLLGWTHHSTVRRGFFGGALGWSF
jgi:hypothetical protein